MRWSIAVMAIAVGVAMTPVAMATELNSEVEENARKKLERAATEYCRILKTEEQFQDCVKGWMEEKDLNDELYAIGGGPDLESSCRDLVLGPNNVIEVC